MTTTVTLGGNPIPFTGHFLQKGEQAPAFTLVAGVSPAHRPAAAQATS